MSLCLLNTVLYNVGIYEKWGKYSMFLFFYSNKQSNDVIINTVFCFQVTYVKN